MLALSMEDKGLRHCRRLPSGAFLLAIAAAAFFLSSCGQKPAASTPAQADAPVDIRVAFWGGPEEIELVHQTIADWQAAHPNIHVILEHTPGGSAYTSKLLTRIASGTAPDIMFAEVTLFVPFWAKGALLDLTPFVESDPEFNLKEFFPEVVGRFTDDGKVYCIPRDTAPFACVYYNKNLFNEGGIPYPIDEWTWADLLDKAQNLTHTENGHITQYGFFTWAWENFIYSSGGNLVDDVETPTRLTLDSPESVRGLEFFSDLIHKYKVAPTPMAMGNLGMGAQQLFMTGRVAMYASGVWETPILRKIKDFDWDIVLFPKGPTGIRRFGTGGSGYCVLSGTHHPREAWEVVKALSGDRGQELLAQAGLAQPAKRTIADGPAWAGDPNPPAHKGILNEAVAHTVYEPFHPRWREIRELYISPAFDLILSGQEPVQKVVSDLVPVVNKIFAEPVGDVVASRHFAQKEKATP